ncbi:MAG: hypothetical protein AB1324_06725 [Candidatus Micrarchaeota archaeon]
MVSLNLRTHPDVLFGYSNNFVEMILRVENHGEHAVWSEADISVGEHLSLSPNNSLRKGRVRVGIVGKNEFLEKSVRVYSGPYTQPQMYKCSVTLFIYNKDGVIESRVEKPYSIRCELKKEASL